MRSRAIYGLGGPSLSAEERAFFSEAKPWGYIVFGRNIVDIPQLRRLTQSLRETADDPHVPILIDQEGGRVSRLKEPVWRKRPPARRFGALFARAPERAREAAYLNARLIASDLSDVGINVDCMPVLDLPIEGADSVIGDRAFGRDPLLIVELGRAVMEGLIDGGVLPVMKHVPGHGRAMADSHVRLPRVAAPVDQLSASDFVAFRSLNHCPLAMTAHVVYETLDPHRPATTSPKVIRDIVRGEIGFDGLLLSDDISMGALSGPISARVKAALFAGCDVVLHCNGGMDEMKAVASEASPLEGQSLKRAEQALAQLAVPIEFDRETAERRLAEFLEEQA